MAGAISGTTIASLIAMAAGTAMQYKASSDAAKRAEQQTRMSIANQAELQRQAETKALGQAQQFAAPERANEQQNIEQALTEEFIKPVENSAEMNAKATTTQGNVSGDYTSAKAASEVNIAKNARMLAGLLGKTTGAGRLRQNEAISMAQTAAGIDRLGNFSRGQAGADQIGIQEAGRPNGGMMAAGSLLSGAGSYGMGGGFNGLTGATGASAAANASGMTGMNPQGGFSIPSLLR